jgi:cephalosporin-C deacetylase-like acetyl esterase
MLSCFLFASASPAKIQTIDLTAEQSYNHQPFSYTMRQIDEKPSYTVYKITYPSPVKSGNAQNDTIYSKYYCPKNANGKSPSPGAVCLHILGGGRGLTRFMCSYLAECGIPAIMCQFPYYGNRRPPGWRQSLIKDPKGAVVLINSFKQAIEDIRRTTDVLASRPEVDPAKISLEGISLGALLGSTAAGVDSRFYKLVFLLGAGDFQKIIGHSRESIWIEKKINELPDAERKSSLKELAKIDPLANAGNLIAKADSGKIMMVNASEDEVLPKEATVKLAKAMNMENKVVWMKGQGHYTAIASLPDLLPKIANFISDNQAKIPQNGNGNKSALSKFAGQLNKLFDFSPPPGRCMVIEAEFKIKDKVSFVKLIKGHGCHFIIFGDILKMKLSLGYCEYPWMYTPKGVLFKGTLEPTPNANLLNHMDKVYLAYLPMITAVLNMAASSPTILNQFAKFTESKQSDGNTLISIQSVKRKNQGAEVLVDKKGKPISIKLNLKDKVEIVFKEWNLNAFSTDELYLPPENFEWEQAVKQKNLDRIFAAFFNQLGDMARK